MKKKHDESKNGPYIPKYYWVNAVVRNMLCNEIYLGHMVNCRARSQSYRTQKKISKEAWLDAGYANEAHVARIKEAYPGIILHICEKGTRNHPLTDDQKESNREKSRVRSRVEHVFGYMTRFMGGIYIRTIGKERAEREICGMNLAYNLKRIAFLVVSKKIPAIS